MNPLRPCLFYSLPLVSVPGNNYFEVVLQQILYDKATNQPTIFVALIQQVNIFPIANYFLANSLL